MSLDIRAVIYCSLGEVISGEISESSIVDAGLITVSGRIIFKGILSVSRGTSVELAYYKQGRLSRLGRKYRVLSSTSNPVSNTTEVAIGCYLTYMAGSTPAPVIVNSTETAATDPDAVQLSEVAKLSTLQPTRAAAIAAECCKAIGLAYSSFSGLTNTFYQENFAISDYLGVLGDLLKSENYVGYVDSNEVLQLINLNSPGSGSGAVLTENEIIDFSTVSNNQRPGDSVYTKINYKVVTLAEELTPGRDDGQDGSDGTTPTTGEWTFLRNIYDRPRTFHKYDIGTFYQGVSIRNKGDWNDTNIQNNYIEIDPNTRVILGQYNPITQDFGIAVYTNLIDPPDEPDPEDDTQNVLNEELPSGGFGGYFTRGGSLERVESKRVYRYEDDFGRVYEETQTWNPGNFWVSAFDSQGRCTRKEEWTYGPWGATYKATSTSYEGSGDTELVRERTVEEIPGPVIAEACGFPEDFIPPLASSYARIGGTSAYKYSYVERGGSRTATYTESREYAPQITTSDGAAAIAQYIESYSANLGVNIPYILAAAKESVLTSSRVDFSSKPPDFSISPAYDPTDVTNEEGAPDGSDPDSNTGDISDAPDEDAAASYNVSEEGEILYVDGGEGGTFFLELTPPYQSDDQIVGVETGYIVVPSDARVKCSNYAQIQNRLRYGRSYGRGVVIPYEYMPQRPFDPVYLSFKGVVGQYRFDSCNIVFDSTGILLSSSCIFWGGVGS